jgi:hypothetical protein
MEDWEEEEEEEEIEEEEEWARQFSHMMHAYESRWDVGDKSKGDYNELGRIFRLVQGLRMV